MFEILFCDNSSTGIQAQFHFTDFFINFFHKLNHKVNKFVFIHLFGMKVSKQKANIISLIINSLYIRLICSLNKNNKSEFKEKEKKNHLNGFSSENNKVFSTLHQETCKFMTKKNFNFVSLFNFNAQTNWVNGAFN